MISKIKTLIVSFGALFIFAAPVLAPAAVMAAPVSPQNQVCAGANHLQIPDNSTNQANQGQCDNTVTGTGGTDKVNKLIRTVLNVLSVIVGIIAVVMIIIGGFQYITSAGSQEKVTKAKNTLLYAIIGLIIVALAQIIVKFILDKAINGTT